LKARKIEYKYNFIKLYKNIYFKDSLTDVNFKFKYSECKLFVSLKKKYGINKLEQLLKLKPAN
jgi:hypothetical protein